MTDRDLGALVRAAADVNRAIIALAEQGGTSRAETAILLTAVSGCFTTLVHIADLLADIRADQATNKASESFWEN
jgi:hypothetical protein